MESLVNKEYKLSKIMYLFEAAIEYFISIAVSTVYLAKLTTYMGISDALTGILSAFVQLGCGFQLFAILIAHKRPVKSWVTALHIISQSLFALIYIVPLFDIGIVAKTIIFVAMLLLAQIMHNVINSPKINWFMSLVEDENRGRFTAKKEMVSLISGIVFSYLLGFVIDYFQDKGEIKTAFIICGIGLFVLMILHTLTLILSKEKSVSLDTIKKVNLKGLITNKTLYKIALVLVFWSVANTIYTAFTGVYQAKELAFTTAFSSIVIMVGSLVRALFSLPMGKFADKFGFTKMLTLCFCIEVVAFLLNTFTTTSNGKVLYFIFYILHAIGMAGINSSIINLIYDYVSPEFTTSALAFSQTLSGFLGFFVTLAVSPLVTLIQANGNKVFGISMYAQQLLSAFSCIIVIGGIVYLNLVVKKLKRVRENKNHS